MDSKIEASDLCFSSGKLCTVKGIEEAAQRAYIACTVKKKSFLYDRNLGADTASLDRTSPDFERALQMALREAIYPIADTDLTVQSVRNRKGSSVACIKVERKGETKEIEVNLDGKL